MKKYYFKRFFAILTVFLVITSGCKKDEDIIMSFDQAKVKATFDSGSRTVSEDNTMILQTPDEYQIGLYSAKLIGTNGTTDYQLFYESNFSNSQIFNFTDGSMSIDLNGSNTIPDGEYVSFEFGIYFLQMRLQIATTNRGIEWRNMRIYFCDYGDFKRGDVVQVDSLGNIQGWLFGENQMPDFDPVTPRIDAYTQNGDGLTWYTFADKQGQSYGPFGNMAFWNSVPNPYTKHAPFTFNDGDGSTLVIDFNVNDCWQFGDYNSDGYFGGHDLDALNPTPWHMELPTITITIQD